jgi:hypothetical protein
MNTENLQKLNANGISDSTITYFKKLFDKYSPEGRKFDPSSIRKDITKGGNHNNTTWGHIGPSNGEKYTYIHNGIEIQEHTRVTTIRGDTDTFTRVEVKVDGKQLYYSDG